MLLYHFAAISFIASTFFLLTGVHSQRIRFPSDDDPPRQGSPARQSCDVTSYCAPIRRCRPLSILPNWRTVGETCGSGSGPSRRVCCPRQDPRSSGPRPPARPTAPRPPARPTEPPLVRPTEPQPPERPPIYRPRSDPRVDNNCGQSILMRDPYIMGGGRAAEGAWPWMVAIQMRGRSGTYSPYCTGFLIDRKHVLSAAHCFDRREPDLYTTRIGSVNQNEGEIFTVSSIAIPEGYTPGRYYDDIAVLTLTRDVPNSPNFNPICLPNEAVASRDLVGIGTTVAGWGAEAPNGRLSVFLKELSALPVVSIQDCNSVYRDLMTSFRRQFPRGINGGFICAGFPEGLQDACGGDSGGPLMHQQDNRWYAVGIVSFGVSCGRPGIPGGYTRISTHLRWIRENTRD